MNRGSIKGGYRAEEYTQIVSPTSGGYASKAFYHVVGMPGLWRRVSKPKVSDAESIGVITCFFDGGFIYLTPDLEANKEMAEGDFRSVLEASRGEETMKAEDAELYRNLVKAVSNSRISLFQPEPDSQPVVNNAVAEPEPDNGTPSVGEEGPDPNL